MAETKGKVCFLARLPRYENEKPCVVVPPAKPKPIEGVNPPNVQRAFHDVEITNVRDFKNDLSLEKHGFQVLSHTTQYPELEELAACDAYKLENQELVKKHLNAERVFTWGLRKRMPKERQKNEQWDYNNPIEIEGPAVMAHCDFTYDRGLVMVDNFLGEEERKNYIANGFRIRIMNTWRPLLPKIEKQPLAICGRESFEIKDMVACDRVLIDDIGEIYLLQHNENQKWYWLDSQTRDEPFLFVTWDSKYPGEARHSPHVSFANPHAPEDAPLRFSVETRSIVITRDENSTAPDQPHLYSFE